MGKGSREKGAPVRGRELDHVLAGLQYESWMPGDWEERPLWTERWSRDIRIQRPATLGVTHQHHPEAVMGKGG